MFDFFRAWLIVVGAGMPSLVWRRHCWPELRCSPHGQGDQPGLLASTPDDATQQFQAWIYGVMGAVMRAGA